MPGRIVVEVLAQVFKRPEEDSDHARIRVALWMLALLASGFALYMAASYLGLV